MKVLAKWIFKPVWSFSTCCVILTLLLSGYNIFEAILPTANDKDLYYGYAMRILQGDLAYQTILVEYPPVALVFFVVPALLNSLNIQYYHWLFHTQCWVLNVFALWLIYRLLKLLYPRLASSRVKARLTLFTVGSVFISLYLYQRFDIGAAVLSLIGLYFFYQKQPFWSGTAFGLAFLAKLYPAVMIPILLLYLWYQPNRRREILPLLASFGLICGLVIGTTLFGGGGEGLQFFLRYHSERGIQLETIFASLIVLASYLNLTEATSILDHGALGLASNWVKPLAMLSTLLTVLGLVGIYGWLWYRLAAGKTHLSSRWLINAISIAVLWFILANKVLSPQYMVWLLVFIPFWKSQQDRLLFLMTLGLSCLAFPFLIDGMIALEPLPYLILAIRNGLLIFILLSLGRQLS